MAKQITKQQHKRVDGLVFSPLADLALDLRDQLNEEMHIALEKGDDDYEPEFSNLKRFQRRISKLFYDLNKAYPPVKKD